MRASQLGKAFAEKFDDEVRFFRGWMHRPRNVGSIVPTSTVAARWMASVTDPSSGLPVLEVGPGTGVVTRAILAHGIRPDRLFAVEYEPEFARRLRQDLPGVTVIEGDAFDMDEALGEHRGLVFDSVVSGVPLLNFAVERRVAYLEDLLARIPAGRPVVQLTYGPKSPVPPGLGDYTVEHFHFVLRNIPPTRLWVYRRPSRN